MRIRGVTRDWQGKLERAEEGYKGYLDHKQYKQEEEEANSSNQLKRQGIASGDVKSGQSEGLSIVLL